VSACLPNARQTAQVVSLMKHGLKNLPTSIGLGKNTLYPYQTKIFSGIAIICQAIPSGRNLVYLYTGIVNWDGLE